MEATVIIKEGVFYMKHTKKLLALLLVGVVLLAFAACGQPADPAPSTPAPIIYDEPRGETKLFECGGLKLEITNVAHAETKTGLDHGTDPYEYTVFTLYPGAQLHVIDADMYDGSDTEEGLPYARWFIGSSMRLGVSEDGNDILTDNKIPIVNHMPYLWITPDMGTVSTEMVSLLVFEWQENL